MKTDLLVQIEAERRRRQHRIYLLSSVAFLILITAAGLFATKTYHVTSRPAMAPLETAHMKLINGSGVAVWDLFFLVSETATLQFSYQGHVTSERIVSRNDQESEFEIELQPALKQVEVKTSPPVDVTWMVDGEFVAESASLQLNLSPSTSHKIDAVTHLGGVVTKEVEIDWIEEGASQEVFDLTKWAVSIKTMPKEADVRAGGKKLGSTPLKFVPSPDQDKVTISKPGFQPQTISLSELIGRADDTLNLSLQPLARAIPISLEPPDGEIVGGTLDPASQQLIPDLPMPRDVTYFKPGFVAETKRVTADTPALKFNLKAAQGILTVTSPLNGSVEVPSFGIYEIPARISLPVGKTSVTVSAEGFQSKEYKVSVFHNETTTISPSLESVEAYRSRTAGQRELAPHGIGLTKIVGKSIRLGAERNVRGQRANEILRDTTFSRHFYFAEREVSEEQFSHYTGRPTNSKLPVVGVSWEEAAKYCNYLSQKQGLPTFYKVRNNRVVGWNPVSIGYRLPTEAEWEYVASKLNKRKRSLFVWGDDYKIPEQNFGNLADKEAEGKAKKIISDRSDGYAERAPVGFSKQVGDITDLSGNVSEWVHDYYSVAASANQPLLDYLGPVRGRQHFIKGSNYLSSSWTELRNSYREPIDGARADVGFRVARYVF